jgi:hypothetical protein
MVARSAACYRLGQSSEGESLGVETDGIDRGGDSMKKRVFLMAAMGLVATLVAGGLVASNMGFKLNAQLLGPAPGVSSSGNNAIALPYNQQTSITTAEDLINDINAVAGSDVVGSVSRFVKADNSLESYTGLTGTNFSIESGQGYFVVVTQDANYIVVGSHNPSLGLSLDAPGTNGSASGTNLYAYPYHSTAANAEDLINEINAHAGADVVGSVSALLIADNSLASYTGLTGTNFSLVPGESYFIVVTSDVAGFVPDHY